MNEQTGNIKGAAHAVGSRTVVGRFRRPVKGLLLSKLSRRHDAISLAQDDTGCLLKVNVPLSVRGSAEENSVANRNFVVDTVDSPMWGVPKVAK